MRSYARPQTLEEAIGLLAERPRRLLAGGTDLYPLAGAQLDGDVMDLMSIPALTGITHHRGLRIGACTTWTELATADLPPACRALQQAAQQVGGRQIQNSGTIGGNLCNASPAADGVPPLLALDARIDLCGPQGTRQLALSDFLTGPRQTRRRPDEVLTAVILPEHALRGRSAFVKLGARAYLVISVVMVAARLQLSAGQISEAAIAVGACSAVAQRLFALEARIAGLTPAAALAAIHDADLGAVLSPIDDVRGSADYRQGAARALICRAVTEGLA